VTSTRLDDLPFDDCLALLRLRRVGRVALMIDDYPLVVPVNYRLVELPGHHWIAIRTRPGGAIERAGVHCAFEIDDIDEEHHTGWSVVVRGTLHHLDPDTGDFATRFDPESWVAGDEATWMVIDAFHISGRSVHGPSHDWALDPS
jgi:nitroimidazol reductase NimA-like FMN-containing flavoprotein (pyridoxamine 5'-phosphate oxidase superfamily)